MLCPYMEMGIKKKRMLISNAKQGLGELGPWFDACGSPYMGHIWYPNILIFDLEFMTSEISMYGMTIMDFYTLRNLVACLTVSTGSDVT